jgi:hypothetical protein
VRGRTISGTLIGKQALEPFRKAYHGRLDYRQQQMLFAQVLQYITRFKPGDEE